MMKTLILNGSPRKNGNTAGLLKVLCDNLEGEIFVVNCYYDDISPCIDCRKCRESDSCGIDDFMQRIYKFIDKCDNVVVGSPIYFNQPTGRYLDTASRFQKYFSKEFFQKKPVEISSKRGGIILTGGGSGDPTKAIETVTLTLKMIKVKQIFPAVISHSTDKISAFSDERAISQIKNLARFLNEMRG